MSGQRLPRPIPTASSSTMPTPPSTTPQQALYPQSQRRYSHNLPYPDSSISRSSTSAPTPSSNISYHHPTFLDAKHPYPPPPPRPSQARPPPECPLPQSNMSLSTAVSGSGVNGEMNLLAEVALAHGSGRRRDSLVLPPIRTEERGRERAGGLRGGQERGRAVRGRGAEVARAGSNERDMRSGSHPYTRPENTSTAQRTSPARPAPQPRQPSLARISHSSSSQSIQTDLPTEQQPMPGTQSSPIPPSRRLQPIQSAPTVARSRRQQPPSLHTRLAARAEQYQSISQPTQESQSSNSTQLTQYSQNSHRTQSTQPTEYSQPSQRSRPSQPSSSSQGLGMELESQGPRWIRHAEQDRIRAPPPQEHVPNQLSLSRQQLRSSFLPPHPAITESPFRFSPLYPAQTQQQPDHPPPDHYTQPGRISETHPPAQPERMSEIHPPTPQTSAVNSTPQRIKHPLAGWKHPLRGLTLDGSNRSSVDWAEDARRVLRTPPSVMGVTFMDDEYEAHTGEDMLRDKSGAYLTPLTGNAAPAFECISPPTGMITPNLRRSLRIAPPSNTRTHSSSLSSTRSAPAQLLSPSPTSNCFKPKRAASTPGTESQAKREKIEELLEEDEDAEIGGGSPLHEVGGRGKWPQRFGDRRRFQNATAQQKHRDKKKELAIQDRIDLEHSRKNQLEQARRIENLEKELARLKGTSGAKI